MSRIGKKIISVPAGVETKLEGRHFRVKGPRGELTQELAPGFVIETGGAGLAVKRPSDTKNHRALHGLYRALISNMVTGVSAGFKKVLEIEGVGYSAKADGDRKLVLTIGFNAPVQMVPPDGVKVATPKNTIIEIAGMDKQKVGQFASEVRGIRPPEPYKGKGIRYQGEVIRRKAGKSIGGKG